MARALRIPIDSFTDWQELLFHLPDPRTFNEKEELKIDIIYKCPEYIDPEIWPILTAYICGIRAREHNVSVAFDIGKGCSSVHYAGRMGFFKHIGVPYEYPYQERDPAGRFIPITQIKSGSYTLDPEFADKISQDLDLDDQMSKAIVFSVGELIANITLHAESPSGGMLYGQRFPNNRTAMFILVDPGVGIHSAFQNGKNEEYHNMSEEECLKICLDQGVSCGDGRGHGLFVIREIISRNLGTLRIISGKHYVSIVNGNVSINKMPHWQGTLIFCEFNLDIKVDMNNVFESYGYEPLELW